MLKLTKTGIGLLSKQYRSVLRKCLLCNLGIFTFFLPNSTALMLCQTSIGTNVDCSEADRQVILSDAMNLSGGFGVYTSNGAIRAQLTQDAGGGFIYMSSPSGKHSLLQSGYLIINSSSQATGIDFDTNVTAGTTNASHLATTGAINQLLNYYYTFRNDKTIETAEFALFLDNEKLSNMLDV